MSEKITRTCPICGQRYTEPPALSRRDNKTYICPDCGTMEALAAFLRCAGPAEQTRRAVHAVGDKRAVENFDATHD